MDLQNTDLQGGTLQISTEVLAKIARCAALEIEGEAAPGVTEMLEMPLEELISPSSSSSTSIRADATSSRSLPAWRTNASRSSHCPLVRCR